MEATLLVELLTEELPPKSLARLGKSFADSLTADLRTAGFIADTSSARWFATPRRLAVSVTHVRDVAPDKEVVIKGPPAKAGYDAEGKPTQALLGFAKQRGISVDALIRINDGKREVFAHRDLARGGQLATNLELMVGDALKALPIPKVMRWGADDAQFVRPVHGLVMLHGSRVVPGTVLGATSGNRTAGHRFMGKQDIKLAEADQYEGVLRDEGMVIADFEVRRSEVERQLKAEAERQHAGLGPYEDLLDEVTALVEHPSVYVGKFEPKYLVVPQECLILTMRQNQKYFPLFDGAGKLLAKFLIVSNMKVADPRHIVGGNERVVRPRLEDARFFYDQDRKQRLEARVPQLAKVVYHRKLGSQLERVERIQLLAGSIARALKTDSDLAKRAAWLSKADLLTGMVGEFPELQGVMGCYYALNDNEKREVADAIEAHYRPRFAGDELPEGHVACAVALADKLDAIVGLFGIGEQPTGEKDPFALRRHALGVIRILIEKKLDIAIRPLVDLAIGELPKDVKTDWLPVVEFVLDRARSYFLDKGFAAVAIEGVIQPFGYSSPLYMLLGSVAEASRIIATEEGRILAEANKRITNILKKSGFPVPFGLRPDELMQKPNPKLFRDKEEVEFWDALQKIGGRSLELKGQHRYAEALGALSELAIPTKSFFDHVLVNAKEPDIQSNRINLLQHARAYMNQVADFSVMAA